MQYIHIGSHCLPHAFRVEAPPGDSRLFVALNSKGTVHDVRVSVVEWLHHNVGPGLVTHTGLADCNVSWLVCLLGHSCIFCFRSKQSASLFKLVWHS